MARGELAGEVTDGSSVAFEADARIYFIERHELFHSVVTPVFERVASGSIRGHASVLTLLEVLVGPLRDGVSGLADRYRQLLLRSRGFTLHSLDGPIAERAAAIRAQYDLRTPDSIVAATALLSGCSHLITNDSVFRRVPDLTVLVVREYL